ncbi:hypothetical protein ASE29_26395 [Ensifer sp. Root74]|nr:hypothetical protein ASD49_31100 [Ensifer sp. Root1298]KRC24533.1 hypothetical protein ASE29_26395 [Ensifer sp. Root74]
MTDSSKSFGTPEFMKGKFMVRAGAAQGGIYGNSVREALYVVHAFDAQKPARTFDGAAAPQNRWAEVLEQGVLRRPLRTKRFLTNTRGALRSPPRYRHIRSDQAD